jgi:RNAse (barnase) inhibitor barstar
MRTVNSLFDEIAASFQFPWYFGENWDALDECLNDLAWLPARSYLLGIMDASQVLSEEEHELGTFARLLTRTCEGWATAISEGQPRDRPAIPFHVLLQCQHGQENETISRFEAAGIPVVLASFCPLG